MRNLGISIFLFAAMTASGELPWSRNNGSQITVKISHDAIMKTPLNQIAFAEPSGKCADLLADSLVADFAQSGATIIDRINFKRIMQEHKLNLSGAIDEKTAAKIGRLIGTGSLVFVKVHDCSTYKTKEMRNSLNGLGVKRTQVPTTRGTMKASIQIVNLTTGVTAAARMIDVKASLSADEMDQSRLARAKNAAVSFLNGAAQYEEYPPEEDVQTLLFTRAVEQVHRLLFAWTDTKQFVFFNDAECSLNVAFQLMQNGDYDGAAREAQTSLDTCKSRPSTKPAIVARAYYNLGMTFYVSEDLTNAIANLTQAAHLDDNKVFTEAMAICNRARVEALASGEGKREQTAPQPRTAANDSGAKLSPEERLRRLDDLHKKKVISDEEYAQKRKEILAQM